MLEYNKGLYILYIFMDSMCQRTMLGVGAKQLAGASCRLILISQYIIIGCK